MNTDIRDIPKLIRLKVRDPRALWAGLSLVVALVLFAIVARLLVAGKIERDLIQGDLDATRARIAQLEGMQDVNPESLQRRIDERRVELQDLLKGFPTTAQADEELGRYYQYASELNTQLVRMEAMLNTPEEDAQTAYRVQRFLLGVRGDARQLLRFLGRLSSAPYETFVIENVAIRPNGGTDDSIANADLVVYASNLVSGTAPIPQVVAPEPTPTLGQTDNITEIDTYMRRAIAGADWAAVIAHGRHILQLDPSRQDVVRAVYQAHVAWGQALAAAGQLSEAREQYTEALALVPDGREGLDALQEIAEATPGPPAAIPTATPIAALPQADTPAPAQVYTVRPGDTLTSVATRHGVSVPALMQTNNLGASTIYVGQELVVPGP